MIGEKHYPTLLHLNLFLERPPWRWTPAWGVLLAAWGTHALARQWLLILAFALVVDAMWGAWWRMAVREPRATEEVPALPLPYARPAAPWMRLHTLVGPGTISGLLFTTGLVAGIAYAVDTRILWPSALALLLAVFTWWLHRLNSQASCWLAPLYLWALPFGSTLYLLGVVDAQAVFLTASLVAGQWALRARSWARAGWGAATLVAWTVAVIAHPPYLVGVTLVLLTITLLERRGPTAATDVAWMLALGLLR